MKTSLTLKRVLTFTVTILAFSVLISMDLDTDLPIKSQSSELVLDKQEESLAAALSLKEFSEDSAQLVLKAYYEAIGGDNWRSIQTIHKTGLVSMHAGASMPLIYGKDMYQGSGEYLLEEINVKDSKLGQVMQDGRVMTIVRNNIYPQSGLEALSFKQHILPIGQMSKLVSASAKYMGKQLMDGVLVYKVFRGRQLGYDVYEYYDVESNLKVITSLGEGCNIKFKSYEFIDGVRIATLVETFFKEFERKVSYEIEQIAMNVEIPNSPIDTKSVSIESVASN